MKKILTSCLFLFFVLTSYAGERRFTTLDGKSLSYEKIVSAPRTILFIWTTWCPYCRQEIERLSQGRLSLEGFEIYYINVGEKKAKVEKFSEMRKINGYIKSKIVVDEEGFFADKFSVVGIPTYIFLEDGKNPSKTYFLDEDLLKAISNKQQNGL
ncbi:MAG: TlpA disulfide reductase family protein [Candidatus Omnitrophica bacterium]|nr:TlpA disulfide reductase family protein [Candidatus Omnitrophota bacterium]MDD5429242.1 TlpA disulfide reductase family protein [Candidatus Omnitrophota bacterium]